MIVTDASVLLELLLGTRAAPRLAERLLDPTRSLHAPHLVDVEVTQAIRRYESRGELPAPAAERALSELLELPLHRHPHGLLLGRAWELRRSITAYDAMYVALAEALDAPLLTMDSKLARAHGHHARVEVP